MSHSQHHDELQKKAFKVWLNGLLMPHGLHPVENLDEDLADAVTLVDMLAILEANGLGRDPILGRKKPTTNRVRRLDNAAFLFQELHRLGVGTTNIGPEDIVDGRSKLLLGLIWRLVSKFSIQAEEDGDEEAQAAKQALLQWCQTAKGSKYQDIAIENFTTSFQDGRAFLILLDYLLPGVLDTALITGSDDKTRLNVAFQVAEKELNLPRSFEAQDFSVKPDEKSVMVYIAALRNGAEVRRKKLEQEKEKLEEEALAKAKLEEEALAKEKLEQEALAKEKLEQEALAKEKLEQEALAKAKLEEELTKTEDDETIKAQTAKMFCQCAAKTAVAGQVNIADDVAGVTGAQLRSYEPGVWTHLAVDEHHHEPKKREGESGFKSMLSNAAKRVEGLGQHIAETGALNAAKELAKKVGAGVDIALEGGKVEHFHSTFKLPAHEEYLSSFNCTLLTSDARLAQGITGRLVISTHFICFISDSLSKINMTVRGFRNDLIMLTIPFQGIYKPVQAMIGPNHSRGTIICTHDHFRFVFYGFYSEQSRSLCWELLSERSAALMKTLSSASSSTAATAAGGPPNKPLPPPPICSVCGLPLPLPTR